MGGIMKGGHHSHTLGHMHNIAAYSSSGRRWNVRMLTAVIVTLVFGCGILGIHRLRDRRNILNQKDDQILSLRLLLQKEREQMQDVIKEREEMKMKVYNLGGQKLELNSKISDMQSTISSLKDELATIETAFQEKQNETKDLSHRVESLTQTLQQREKDIEDLKHRLQLANASNQSENGRSENSEEISGANGRANVERGEDSDDRKEVETSNSKGGVKLENVQENSRGENLRTRGKRRSYLRRSNGKRWRVTAKQIQGKNNNRLEEPKATMIQLNDSVAKDQRFTVDDSEQGKTKVQLRGYIEESNGENSTKPVALTNSSIVLEANPNYSAKESGGDGSSNTSEDIVIAENAKNENYGKHDDNSSDGEKEVAEKNEDVKMENFEDSDEPDQF